MACIVLSVFGNPIRSKGGSPRVLLRGSPANAYIQIVKLPTQHGKMVSGAQPDEVIHPHRLQ